MGDVIYQRQAELLDAYGRQIPVSNNVRLNLDQKVIRTFQGLPYQPQHFPVSPPGGWRILGVKPETADDLAPFAILTDAHQLVPEWLLTPDGKYDKLSGRMIPDINYWIHFSIFDFTYGCIRVIRKEDLIWFAGQVQEELAELAKLNPHQAWISFEAAA